MSKKKLNGVPRLRGCVIDNNGYWFWFVRLPGESTRHKRPICAPNCATAMRSDRPKELAIECARRMWEEATRAYRAAPTSSRSVDEVCAAYLAQAQTYYQGGHECYLVTCALRPLRELFGKRPIGEIVHTDLLAVRDALIRRGLVRKSVNKYMCIISNRFAPWAFDNGLMLAATKAEFAALAPLKPHRSAAKETEPIRAAKDEAIEAAIAAMMPNTADMVRVHALTGMRPAEMCALRWGLIDTSVTPWVYRPEHHKNEWRGNPRVILIGKKARQILERHRDREYPFSPLAAVAERMEAIRAAAVCPAKRSRAKEDAQIKPLEKWSRDSYTRTVFLACRRAGCEKWTPNQLRHTFATKVRRAFGLAAAAAVLGHSSGGKVTDRYSFEAAEDEFIAAAAPAVEALG